MWIFRNKKSPFYTSRGVTANERLLTAEEVGEVFNNQGFEAKTFAVSGISFQYVESEILKMLLPVYNFFDGLFGRIDFLSSRYGSFILTFAKKY